MVSIIFCKVGALLPSNPSDLCLVFLIWSGCSVIKAGEVKFYRISQCVPKCSRLMTLVGLGSGLRVEVASLGIVKPRC